MTLSKTAIRILSKITVCLIIVLVVLLLTAFAVYISNQDISVHYWDFSADDAGNIYLGKLKGIEVISPEGEHLRSIDTHTNRRYYFVISDQNTIYLNAMGQVMILDLEGNLLSDPVSYNELDDSQKIEYNPRRCVTSDGTVYVLRSPLCRPTVYRLDGVWKTPIYKMPMPDYIVRVLLILAWYTMLVMNILIVILLTKKEPQRKIIKELQPVDSYATKQALEANMKKTNYKSQWKSIPKWMLPAAIVFFGGCIILIRLAFSASEDVQMYYHIAFLAWAIICCTVITILLMRPRKK